MSERKLGRPKLSDGPRWTDRELVDFTTALQRFGFGNTKKIALHVKTKSENAVKALMNLHMTRARRNLSRGSGRRGRKSTFHSVQPKEGEANGWPTLRKWLKIVQNQQMDCVRKVDYSPLVIPEIWDRFQDEANQSPKDCQVVDTGVIYGFIAECVRGRRPPDLPPKESATLLMLMKFVREIILELDLEEEEKFIQGFRKATTFAPFAVKDEFKKTVTKSIVCPPGAVPIPEELHSGLSRHRKLVQSFNPMTTPLWLQVKEQQFFTSMFENANP